MLIKGIQKTTLLDYPGKIASIIFLAGCNFRCPYCQNPSLVNGYEEL
ncbi:MAG: anaerobic ribonucleoside-triphosphate reductase activating protein, partial [Candidatus Hydrothermarchaeota archaeon]|nr:anaerobic ribonucleoside-triphosphate reductase activating protein [Candidatus Hydrothermarchaeota archaeon]